MVIRPVAVSYGGYADLARSQVRGRDYEIVTRRRPASAVAVFAPHGGGIERGTSAIARAIAGDDFNLYLFEGLRAAGNFEALHLSSHRYDEPEALALAAGCDVVLTVHGCEAEPDPGVLLGGLDGGLQQRIALALAAAGVATLTDGHRYPGRHPDNLCNRGRTRRGAQLELTGRLRGGPLQATLVDAVRAVLHAADRAAVGALR